MMIQHPFVARQLASSLVACFVRHGAAQLLGEQEGLAA
jgi:hypothetical protein